MNETLDYESGYKIGTQLERAMLLEETAEKNMAFVASKCRPVVDAVLPDLAPAVGVAVVAYLTNLYGADALNDPTRIDGRIHGIGFYCGFARGVYDWRHNTNRDDGGNRFLPIAACGWRASAASVDKHGIASGFIEGAICS